MKGFRKSTVKGFRKSTADRTKDMELLIHAHPPGRWIDAYNSKRWSWIVFTDDLRILYNSWSELLIAFWKE